MYAKLWHFPHDLSSTVYLLCVHLFFAHLVNSCSLSVACWMSKRNELCALRRQTSTHDNTHPLFLQLLYACEDHRKRKMLWHWTCDSANLMHGIKFHKSVCAIAGSIKFYTHFWREEPIKTMCKRQMEWKWSQNAIIVHPIESHSHLCKFNSFSSSVVKLHIGV